MKPRPRRDDDAGFVIIGVVIFVLALAILGVSLFSLSSIEAEFFGRTENETQAFYSAQSGVEWAKAVLLRTERLENVKLYVRDSLGVLDAVAIQPDSILLDSDSTGALDWNGQNVILRVQARIGATTRRLQGVFDVQRGHDFYRRLLTTSTSGDVNTTPIPGYGSRQNTFVLDGSIWQNAASHAWTNALKPPPPTFDALPAEVVAPGTEAFIQQHRLGATVVPFQSSGIYTLPGSSSIPSFFATDEPFGHPGASGHPDTCYSMWAASSPSITIRVSGLCVWMFPDGATFRVPVSVEKVGSGPACLAIVANPNLGDTQFGNQNDGLWFFGGLDAPPDIPVILVSSGRVFLEQFSQPQNSFTIEDASIYAGAIVVSGPVQNSPAPGISVLHHVQGGLLDDYVSIFASFRALPNLSPDTGDQVRLVPGSWQDD